MRAGPQPCEPESKPSRCSERRQHTDRAIVEGYRRTPPTTAEHDAAIASLRDAIAEEPW